MDSDEFITQEKARELFMLVKRARGLIAEQSSRPMYSTMNLEWKQGAEDWLRSTADVIGD